MIKVRSHTGKLVHFGTIVTHTEVLLACQGNRKALGHRTHYTDPLTCKRCWAMRVHNARTALIALGIPLVDYELILSRKSPEYAKARLEELLDISY